MNPTELRRLSKLYKERNELIEKQGKRIFDLDLHTMILELARKMKQELEQKILKKAKKGELTLHYYGYYVVDAFLQDGSIDSCKRTAEKYGALAQSSNSNFHVEESASLYALYSLKQDGFDIRTERRPSQTGTHVSAYELVIDWSCPKENDNSDSDFEEEIKELRAMIQKLKETNKLQEKTLLLEIENRTLRQMANKPEKQDIYKMLLENLPKG